MGGRNTKKRARRNMAATASGALTSPLSYSLFPGQVRGVSNRRVHVRGKLGFTRKCTEKSAPATSTANLELQPPPYPLNALEPHMSRETLEFHWGKHHRAYVDKLKMQIAGTELKGMSLEDIVLATYNNGDMLPSFDNAAQAWNHQFFWESMKPDGGGKPSGELLRLIERDFGSFDRFLEEFKAAAAIQFGSGWAWLVYKANRLDVGNAVNPLPTEEDKKLVVVKSPNAVNPLVWDYSPLLTIDVWEHAYYLDFQSRRRDYVATFMEKLVSWEAVSARLEIAKAKATEREEEERKKEEEKDKEDDARDQGDLEMLLQYGKSNGSDRVKV